MMTYFVGFLLSLVCLAGAAVVGFTVYKIAREKTDSVWEYLIAILLGAGLLVWPAVKGASLIEGERDAGASIEVDDFAGLRIRQRETGEELTVARDAESGSYELRQTQPPRREPPLPAGEDGTETSESGTEAAEDGTEPSEVGGPAAAAPGPPPG